MAAQMNSRELAILLACSALLGACATARQDARDPSAERELSEALEGRVAGKPERCINNDSSVQVEVIDQSTILYRDGRTLYVQNPRGGCPGLGGGTYTLIARPFGSQLCDRDIINLADLRTGMGGPTCVFGPFIPYTRPAS
jgi:hypothetical protein